MCVSVLHIDEEKGLSKRVNILRNQCDDLVS